ncbi:MAG: hypothetical protein ABR574_07270 [Cryomorphaceae bacterium]|nr:hypothetical protein [Flavobacteriales bacterium]
MSRQFPYSVIFESMISRATILGIIFLICACAKENEPPAHIPYSHAGIAPVNTGYYAYDQNGIPLRVVGIPNTLREVETEQGKVEMITFPNPLWYDLSETGSISWRSNVGGPIPDGPRKAILVSANSAANQQSNGSFINGAFHQVLNDSLVVWEGTYTNGEYSSVIDVTIQVDEPGDYRLYLEIDGYYLYDNLAVRKYLTF